MNHGTRGRGGSITLTAGNGGGYRPPRWRGHYLQIWLCVAAINLIFWFGFECGRSATSRCLDAAENVRARCMQQLVSGSPDTRVRITRDGNPVTWCTTGDASACTQQMQVTFDDCVTTSRSDP